MPVKEDVSQTDSLLKKMSVVRAKHCKKGFQCSLKPSHRSKYSARGLTIDRCSIL